MIICFKGSGEKGQLFSGSWGASKTYKNNLRRLRSFDFFVLIAASYHLRRDSEPYSEGVY